MRTEENIRFVHPTNLDDKRRTKRAAEAFAATPGHLCVEVNGDMKLLNAADLTERALPIYILETDQSTRRDGVVPDLGGVFHRNPTFVSPDKGVAAYINVANLFDVNASAPAPGKRVIKSPTVPGKYECRTLAELQAMVAGPETQARIDALIIGSIEGAVGTDGFIKVVFGV